MPRKRTSVVYTLILTWNSADDIIQCLRSVEKSKYPSEILVIDNDSSDKTRSIVAKKFPNVSVVNTHDNLGYAGGNNFGLQLLKDSNFDYCLILNPDAIVDPY